MSMPYVLGTVWFGRVSPREVLDTFYELGGRELDTARAYPGSESAIGEWARSRGVTEDLHIITKGGHPDHATNASRLSYADLNDDLSVSLEELGRDSVNSFLLHRDDRETPAAEIAAALSDIVASGRAHSIGVSNWRADRVESLARELESIGGPSLSWVSNAYGLAAVSGPPPFPGIETAEPDLLDLRQDLGFRILAWSAMSQGYFTGGRSASSPNFDTAENRRRKGVLESVAEAHSARPADVLARWAATADPGIVPVFGPGSADHVREVSAAATNEALDGAVRDLIDRLGPASRDTGRYE